MPASNGGADPASVYAAKIGVHIKYQGERRFEECNAGKLVPDIASVNHLLLSAGVLIDARTHVSYLTEPGHTQCQQCQENAEFQWRFQLITENSEVSGSLDRRPHSCSGGRVISREWLHSGNYYTTESTLAPASAA
ncbi:uncharacterized protein EI90DRAFT_3285729 [Cantharellus anzutake]|uniref:uncharacterized protein n=1 Tax=Cantharellus anzutake TaxID=1750568 RepID=UPI00190528BD|nr:uncharacterized protein EI90DRAFT_3285729 [Cantharellus anzutake]KAF8340273.1 hypothetical protein EI90DRAFT_3285729 [Cantharellus anzutake]